MRQDECKEGKQHNHQPENRMGLFVFISFRRQGLIHTDIPFTFYCPLLCAQSSRHRNMKV